MSLSFKPETGVEKPNFPVVVFFSGPIDSQSASIGQSAAYRRTSNCRFDREGFGRDRIGQ
jgi:hypothetical protein